MQTLKVKKEKVLKRKSQYALLLKEKAGNTIATVSVTNLYEDSLEEELNKWFKEVRPSQFPANDLTRKTILKGYTGYDLEKGEVYPAIMQLKRRASLTEEKEDFRTESEYKAKIIAELKKLEN